jgi:hypothetical protein
MNAVRKEDLPLEEIVILDTERTAPYRTSAILGYLSDSPHFDFSKAEFLYNNPLVVKSEDGRTIGHAVVHIDENWKVLADIFLIYSTPERLEIETGAMRWYPRILGTMGPQESTPCLLQFYGEPRKILTVYFLGVVLTREAPTQDSTGRNQILPLGEKIL